MGATGLFPHPDDKPPVRVSKDRLAEFDRLMEEGGVEAVMKALEGLSPAFPEYNPDTLIRGNDGRLTAGRDG